MAATRLCPRCHYVRRDKDSATLPGVCPACGIAYAKWAVMKARQQGGDAALQQTNPPSPQSARQRFAYQFLYMQSDRDESAFWAHVVLFILFTCWGWWLIFNGLDFSVIGSSFLHVVSGPFHQYGHVVFRPFGETLALLGGSIFQIAVPLAACGYFSLLRHDNFPASLMLWWTGQNFLDIAPYIADAGDHALPVPERDPLQHDWSALLGNAPEAGDSLAGIIYLLGILIMLVSNYWGFSLLRIEFNGRTSDQGQE